MALYCTCLPACLAKEMSSLCFSFASLPFPLWLAWRGVVDDPLRAVKSVNRIVNSYLQQHGSSDRWIDDSAASLVERFLVLTPPHRSMTCSPRVMLSCCLCRCGGDNRPVRVGEKAILKIGLAAPSNDANTGDIEQPWNSFVHMRDGLKDIQAQVHTACPPTISVF